MPTNILRRSGERPGPRAKPAGKTQRVLLSAGKIVLELDLAASDTVSRLIAALPLFSSVETWGSSIHFEVPVRTGRDRTARINAVPGEVYFWAEEERIIVPFGPTPISRGGECRLPAPCNVIGRVLGDATALASVTPGEKAGLALAKS